MVSVADFRSVLQTNLTTAERDLADIFSAFDDPFMLRDELLDVYPDLVQVYGDEGAAFAADFYDDRRAASNPGGSYRATLAPPIPVEQSIGSLRWAIGPLFSGDWDAALQQLVGASTRLIQEPARETLRWNVDRDPTAVGWRREARADSCRFCRMLAARGGVYTQESAFFAAHDNCKCVIAPSWDPNAERVPAPLYEISRRTSRMSPQQKEAHRSRVYAYLEEHADELS